MTFFVSANLFMAWELRDFWLTPFRDDSPRRQPQSRSAAAALQALEDQFPLEDVEVHQDAAPVKTGVLVRAGDGRRPSAGNRPPLPQRGVWQPSVAGSYWPQAERGPEPQEPAAPLGAAVQPPRDFLPARNFLQPPAQLKTQVVEKSALKAQYWQDEALDLMFFQGKRNGFFVESGAGDGIFGSNTYYFEKVLGWRGLCIEPLEAHVKQLRERRSCKVLRGALCGTASAARSFKRVEGWQGRSGFSDVLPESYSAELKANRKEVTVIEEQIPCFNLEEVLASEGIRHVDLIALDVEGAELEILNNFRFQDGLKVDAWLVEVAPGDQAMSIRTWMADHGYSDPWRIDAKHPDDIFFSNDMISGELWDAMGSMVVACSENCRCPVSCPADSWKEGSVECSGTRWASRGAGCPSSRW